MNLLEIIENIPQIHYKDFGDIIPFVEIQDACKSYNFDNKDILESKLKQLENDGYLKLAVQQDVIIGVKF